MKNFELKISKKNDLFHFDIKERILTVTMNDSLKTENNKYFSFMEDIKVVIEKEKNSFYIYYTNRNSMFDFVEFDLTSFEVLEVKMSAYNSIINNLFYNKRYTLNEFFEVVKEVQYEMLLQKDSNYVPHFINEIIDAIKRYKNFFIFEDEVFESLLTIISSKTPNKKQIFIDKLKELNKKSH